MLNCVIFEQESSSYWRNKSRRSRGPIRQGGSLREAQILKRNDNVGENRWRLRVRMIRG